MNVFRQVRFRAYIPLCIYKIQFNHRLDSTYFVKPHDLSILYSTKVNLDSPMAVKNSIDGQALNVYLGKSKIQC